ncbi:hypothetical protein L484_023444 [Morus notabilis]|uniref:Uncharacterized protein n=1 Tax=Morus notabilis TaxID=981085 RepID=W9RNV9_9ROSA|nr:hypothetical protein L484_023444 [Morus notabilis]
MRPARCSRRAAAHQPLPKTALGHFLPHFTRRFVRVLTLRSSRLCSPVSLSVRRSLSPLACQTRLVSPPCDCQFAGLPSPPPTARLSSSDQQVSLSAFAFLFSELVQYNQTQVDNIAELEQRLEDAGYAVGARVLELLCHRIRLKMEEIVHGTFVCLSDIFENSFAIWQCYPRLEIS